MTAATMTTPNTNVAKPNGQQQQQLSPAQKFRSVATNIAGQLLREWVGEDRAKEAVGRISAALSASAASARDPSDFYACTPASIATCVAISALTGLMPGTGSSALAYVVPQRPRKDEPPQLQYSLSHRGLNALARRCGQTMIAVPIGITDKIEVSIDGDIRVITRNIDDPPTTFDEVRGVLVIVKELSSGQVVAREWLPKKLIEKRRAMSRSWSGIGRKYSPWENWPVEMCIKTAMHYAIARGWCVIDDTEAARALSADTDSDFETTAIPFSDSPRLEHKSKSDELAAMLAKPTDDAGSDSAATGEESQEQTAEDLIPYWLGIIAECKDQAALVRKNETFNGVRADVSADDQVKIDAAFTEKLAALTAK